MSSSNATQAYMWNGFDSVLNIFELLLQFGFAFGDFVLLFQQKFDKWISCCGKFFAKGIVCTLSCKFFFERCSSFLKRCVDNISRIDEVL
jgi:hypothetical protein